MNAEQKFRCERCGAEMILLWEGRIYSCDNCGNSRTVLGWKKNGLAVTQAGVCNVVFFPTGEEIVK